MPKRFGKARAKRERFVAKMDRENKGKPGYVGACLGLKLTGPDGVTKSFGQGALFVYSKRRTVVAPEPAPEFTIHDGPVPPLNPVEGQNPPDPKADYYIPRS